MKRKQSLKARLETMGYATKRVYIRLTKEEAYQRKAEGWEFYRRRRGDREPSVYAEYAIVDNVAYWIVRPRSNIK